MAMLTLEDANRITAAAQSKAAELSIEVTVTVLDAGSVVRHLIACIGGAVQRHAPL